MPGLQFKNARVQALRRLLANRRDRWEQQRFVVEGPVAAREAVDAGWRCVEQFVPEGRLGDAVAGAGDVVQLAEAAFERVGSTETPQAPLVVVEMPADRADSLRDAAFVVVLDRVRDPGNLGTIMRSAEAAGIDAVVLTPGSVDPFNPKVVRASAAAIFHVPVVFADLDEVHRAGFRLLGTSSHAAPGRSVVAHTEADLTGRLAIVVGNEAAGLPDQWTDERGPIDAWVTIPHHGRSESLNVAMAATVLVFEAARQRSG